MEASSILWGNRRNGMFVDNNVPFGCLRHKSAVSILFVYLLFFFLRVVTWTLLLLLTGEPGALLLKAATAGGKEA